MLHLICIVYIDIYMYICVYVCFLIGSENHKKKHWIVLKTVLVVAKLIIVHFWSDQKKIRNWHNLTLEDKIGSIANCMIVYFWSDQKIINKTLQFGWELYYLLKTHDCAFLIGSEQKSEICTIWHLNTRLVPLQTAWLYISDRIRHCSEIKQKMQRHMFLIFGNEIKTL